MISETYIFLPSPSETKQQASGNVFSPHTKHTRRSETSLSLVATDYSAKMRRRTFDYSASMRSPSPSTKRNIAHRAKHRLSRCKHSRAAKHRTAKHLPLGETKHGAWGKHGFSL